MDLSNLYNSPQNVSFLHTQYYVEGCLLGACACPEIPLPDVWLPWVIKHHNKIETAAQADNITDILFSYFKACLAQMNADSLTIPEYAVYSDNQKRCEALQQWCEGLLFAHSAREQFWQGAWRKMQNKDPKNAPQMSKDLKHCLMMFATFANPQGAIDDARKKGAQEAKVLSDNLPTIAKSLPDALRKYVQLSGKLASYLPNQFETFTPN